MKKIATIFLLTFIISLIASTTYAAQKLTMMLDWFPNVDHLPIYVAKHQGYFSEAGLEIEIISPSETSDALKLAAAGNVNIAISYEPQLIIAAARGLDVVAFGRLIEHPSDREPYIRFFCLLDLWGFQSLCLLKRAVWSLDVR